MKYINKLLLIGIVAFTLTSCGDFLELQPTDSVTADALFSSEGGINAYLANLYYQLPIEDFNSCPATPFRFNPGDANNAGGFPLVMTDEAIGSEQQDISPVGTGYNWWTDAYVLNKDINLFFSYIPQLTSISEETRSELYGQAWFARAYTYFELAKIYGGVPIITMIGNVDDESSMNVPRSTEKATWQYVLTCCDSAAYFLGDGDASRRKASKWAALALKSRVALYAASVAKFWNEAPLSGKAVDEGLVGGMNDADANAFYQECIDASAEIMKSGIFTLYQPMPADAKEAEANLVAMFQNPNVALDEAILIKGYNEQGAGYGHNFDVWGTPNQTRGSWPHPGRYNPSLGLADNFESYSKPGEDTPIVTTEDGATSDYGGYSSAKEYKHYSTENEIFADKDARLWAYTILPGTEWKGTKIVIQGGIIFPDGTAYIEPSENVSTTVDGTTYYAYGASGPAFYSGFQDYNGNMTRSGFLIRKFLDPKISLISQWNLSTTDWLEFRYAEVLLNYAEAVAESGLGDKDLAKTALNSTRRRAAFMTDIELTSTNVQRERRSEFAFENKRLWDLQRRREYHKLFSNTRRTALVPVFDTRTKDYIFVREYVSRTTPKTWEEKWYYKAIPGIATNGLIQNPQY